MCAKGKIFWFSQRNIIIHSLVGSSCIIGNEKISSAFYNSTTPTGDFHKISDEFGPKNGYDELQLKLLLYISWSLFGCGLLFTWICVGVLCILNKRRGNTTPAPEQDYEEREEYDVSHIFYFYEKLIVIF